MSNGEAQFLIETIHMLLERVQFLEQQFKNHVQSTEQLTSAVDKLTDLVGETMKRVGMIKEKCND